ILAGEECCGFSQELLLQPELAEFFLQFTEPGSFGDRQWRLLAGVIDAVGVDPIPQRLLVHPDLPRGRRDRPRFLNHHPSDLFLVFRSKRPALFRHDNLSSKERTLVGSLSGRSVAPQLKCLAILYLLMTLPTRTPMSAAPVRRPWATA